MPSRALCISSVFLYFLRWGKSKQFYLEGSQHPGSSTEYTEQQPLSGPRRGTMRSSGLLWAKTRLSYNYSWQNNLHLLKTVILNKMCRWISVLACSSCSRRKVEAQLGRRTAPAPLLSSPLLSSPLHLPLTLPTAPPRRLPDPASPGAAPWAVPCRAGADRIGSERGGPRRWPQLGSPSTEPSEGPQPPRSLAPRGRPRPSPFFFLRPRCSSRPAPGEWAPLPGPPRGGSGAWGGEGSAGAAAGSPPPQHPPAAISRREGVRAREAARAGTAAGLRRLKRPGLALQACGRLRRGGCCPLLLKLLRKCRAGGVRSLLRGLKLAPSVGACAMDVVRSRSPVVANFLTL